METFYGLIDELIRLPPSERDAAEERLEDRFGVEGTVLALDMSGFSLSVRRHGIVIHLCQIRRVQRIAIPIVESNRGEVVKCEADNVLATFRGPADAVAAALAIHDALAAADADPVLDHALTAAIGLDHGRFLLVPGKDAFGDAVNVAYKLGEDVARAGEVLATKAVVERLPAKGFRATPFTLSVSGLQLEAWRVERG